MTTCQGDHPCSCRSQNSSAKAELAALGLAIGESLVASDLAAVIGHHRRALQAEADQRSAGVAENVVTAQHRTLTARMQALQRTAAAATKCVNECPDMSLGMKSASCHHTPCLAMAQRRCLFPATAQGRRSAPRRWS